MFINPLAVNHLANYQLLIQQAQQSIPNLLPKIQSTEASSPVHAFDPHQQPHPEFRDKLDLHTTVDYTPWLKHLFQLWLSKLEQAASRKLNQKFDQSFVWSPDLTAHKLNDIALLFTGWIWHQNPEQPWWDSIETVTLMWRETWDQYYQDIEKSGAKIGVKEAIRFTGMRFNQLWLESWLHLGELQQAQPSLQEG